MTVVTFETIKHLADELSPDEQMQLIEHLSQQLVIAVRPQRYSTESPTAIDSAWSEFFAICEDIRLTYPHVNFIRRLEEDRRERETVLWGTQGQQEHVHP